jgi:hypothetical protein
VEKGAKLSRVLLRSCTILNFYISLGRAAFGNNFDIDMGGGLLYGGILMLRSGGLHERHAVQRGICVSTQHLLQDRGKPRKTLIELAGRRTFRMRTDFLPAVFS